MLLFHAKFPFLFYFLFFYVRHQFICLIQTWSHFNADIPTSLTSWHVCVTDISLIFVSLCKISGSVLWSQPLHLQEAVLRTFQRMYLLLFASFNLRWKLDCHPVIGLQSKFAAVDKNLSVLSPLSPLRRPTDDTLRKKRHKKYHKCLRLW